jgi:hypothetical protein
VNGETDVTGSDSAGRVAVRTKMCWICGQYSYIRLPHKVYVAWEIHDVHIDDAWPDGPVEERRLLLTGVHGKCWDAEFGDEENKV